MAEKAKVMKKAYDVATETATITFVESGNTVSLKLSDLSESLRIQAALHGILQKLGDAASGESGDEAEDSVSSVLDMLLAGNWKAEREKGEARPTMIAEAVLQFKTEQGALKEGETLETIIARYSGDDGKEQRKKAMAVPRVAAIVAQKRAEAAAAKAAKALEKANAAASTATPTDVSAL